MEDDAYLRFLEQRRARIYAHIEAAAKRAGRSSSEIDLVAVSKTVDTDAVELAWKAGYKIFGENRPQELRRKTEALFTNNVLPEASMHMIGNLQKNKINQVLDSNVALIHSVSSLALAQAVSDRAYRRDKTVPILLEVNVSGEQSKAGMSPVDVQRAVAHVEQLPGVKLVGLMAMAPAHKPDEARRSFSGLRQLRDRLAQETDSGLPVLSCGMSDDFEIAVEEGSTLVRLGRIVFDPTYEYE